MKDIKSFTLKELQAFIVLKKFPAFQARQVFSWIYQKRIEDFGLMTNLSQDLRNLLKIEFYFSKLKLIDKKTSKDAAEKFLFKLEDGNLIESVIIPMGSPRGAQRFTGCISTQVGCKFKCLFCASGKSGFIRNLTAGEIVNQILFLRDTSIFSLEKIGCVPSLNIVFMGIGEPLDNYDNLLSAIRIINDKNGLNIGARKITISTCGLIPQIEKLSRENLQIELSISLHSVSDKIRSRLMPINKRYPLEELIKTCKDYYKKTKRQITFEYVMIKGLNSSLQDALNLAKILKGFDSKINLILYNKTPEFEFQPPEPKEVKVFIKELERSGLNVTLRRPRGQDIEAACGQLRIQNLKCKTQNDN